MKPVALCGQCMTLLRARHRWEEKGKLERMAPCTCCALRGITYPPLSDKHPHAVFYTSVQDVATALEEWRRAS